MSDWLEEAAPLPRRRIKLAPIAVILGTVSIAAVVGLGLMQRGQTQLTSGPAPDFTIPTFDGGSFRLSDRRGKVVVINFWASWCLPCRVEAPILQATWERYRDRGVVLVGVDYVDTERDARAFIGEFGLTYPMGPDIGMTASTAYHVQGVPETFVVDQRGDIAKFLYGGVTEANLAAVIDRLLTES